MKRIIAFLLALTMLFAISACGGEETKPEQPKKEVDVVEPEKEPYEEKVPPAENAPEVSPEPEDVPVGDGVPDVPSTPEEKPSEKPAEKPTEKPSEPKPEVLPEVKPEPKPEVLPEPKPENAPAGGGVPDVPSTPEEKPSEKPSGTVGDALATDFRANSGKSGQEIADTVIKNSVIPSELPLMTMEVEEGYLTGFDNTEIKGFENGVMFAPAMGTIPFVGYVFTLPGGADVDAFAKNLKEGANLRWNVCTEAEQMIVEKSGSKVFFLMCPKSFEQ